MKVPVGTFRSGDGHFGMALTLRAFHAHKLHTIRAYSAPQSHRNLLGHATA